MTSPLPENDWLEAIRRHAHSSVAELPLADLRAGDTVLVQTQHTRYLLRWDSTDAAELTTDRPNRPSGRVCVQGCALGSSAAINPSALFTGGSLEFLWAGGAMRHRTTPILALHWLRRSTT